jgi:hypothetical protein
MSGMSKWIRMFRCERGDVLMEYVVLTVLILFPLTVYDQVLFNPAGAVKGDLGFFGEQFVGWIQRMISGISLPIP